MMEEERVRKAVDEFIAEQVDTVPQLEGLLILWNSRPKEWPPAEMARALYVSPDAAQRILQDLARRGLIAVVQQPERYFYQQQSEEKESIIRALDSIYRREIIRISTMIHSKASAAVREFARAFRFTKERESDKEKR